MKRKVTIKINEFLKAMFLNAPSVNFCFENQTVTKIKCIKLKILVNNA